MVYEEMAGLVEVRPGRHLFCRHWVLGCNEGTDIGVDKKEIHHNAATTTTADQINTKNVHLVCIHGTAASHGQYLSVLEALESKLDSSKQLIVQAWLYDAVGCGESPKPTEIPSSLPSSSTARSSSPYSDEEQVLDLDAFLHKLVWKTPHHQTRRIFFLAHSYGPNWVYKWMIYHQNQNKTSDPKDLPVQSSSSSSSSIPPVSLLSQVEGLVLISTGVKDSTLLVRGGPPIFRYCPLWVLRCSQPLLTNMFLKMGLAQATHRSQPELVTSARNSNNNNDMEIVCHYYNAHDWLSQTDLSKFYDEFVLVPPAGSSNSSSRIKVKVLVIHGVEDRIIPIEKGQVVANILMVPVEDYANNNNNDEDNKNLVVGQSHSNVNNNNNKGLVIVPDASHSVMQEQPEIVSDNILQFIL